MWKDGTGLEEGLRGGERRGVSVVDAEGEPCCHGRCISGMMREGVIKCQGYRNVYKQYMDLHHN